jgi:hypothetical protein
MKRKGEQAAYFKCITKDCQASLSLNVKVCGQARGKRGYKIHLAACKKKALKDT